MFIDQNRSKDQLFIQLKISAFIQQREIDLRVIELCANPRLALLENLENQISRNFDTPQIIGLHC